MGWLKDTTKENQETSQKENFKKAREKGWHDWPTTPPIDLFKPSSYARVSKGWRYDTFGWGKEAQTICVNSYENILIQTDQTPTTESLRRIIMGKAITDEKYSEIIALEFKPYRLHEFSIATKVQRFTLNQAQEIIQTLRKIKEDLTHENSINENKRRLVYINGYSELHTNELIDREGRNGILDLLKVIIEEENPHVKFAIEDFKPWGEAEESFAQLFKVKIDLAMDTPETSHYNVLSYHQPARAALLMREGEITPFIVVELGLEDFIEALEKIDYASYFVSAQRNSDLDKHPFARPMRWPERWPWGDE